MEGSAKRQMSDWDSFDWFDLIGGATCLACGRSSRDSLIRQVCLLYQGVMNEAYSPPLDKIQYCFCRLCLTSLPIFFPTRTWTLPDSRVEVITPFYYRPPISLLIVKLKFYQQKFLARPLASLSYIILQQFWSAFKDHILVPIPLSKSRFRERGYNQAGLFAGELARLTELPFQKDLLVRVKETKRQTETGSRRERISNLKAAFALNQGILEEIQNNREGLPPILLIDDVTTTGATLKEAAACLREAGFYVSCLCLAWDQA